MNTWKMQIFAGLIGLNTSENRTGTLSGFEGERKDRRKEVEENRRERKREAQGGKEGEWAYSSVGHDTCLTCVKPKVQSPEQGTDE